MVLGRLDLEVDAIERPLREEVQPQHQIVDPPAELQALAVVLDGREKLPQAHDLLPQLHLRREIPRVFQELVSEPEILGNEAVRFQGQWLSRKWQVVKLATLHGFSNPLLGEALEPVHACL